MALLAGLKHSRDELQGKPARPKALQSSAPRDPADGLDSLIHFGELRIGIRCPLQGAPPVHDLDAEKPLRCAAERGLTIYRTVEELEEVIPFIVNVDAYDLRFPLDTPVLVQGQLGSTGLAVSKHHFALPGIEDLGVQVANFLDLGC